MIGEQSFERKPGPGGKPAEAAALCAQGIVAGGGLFDEVALEAAIAVHALVRRIFNSVTGAPQTGRLRSADPMDPRKMALQAVEAAGTLVALRRGPRGSVAGSLSHWQIVQEICETAQHVVENTRIGAPESPGLPSDLKASVIEAASKALSAVSKLAHRSAGSRVQ
jgi:hypothetical protein